MRLTKHIAEDFDLKSRAKRLGDRRRPALFVSRVAVKTNAKHTTPALAAAFRAFLKLLKFRCQ